MIDFQINPALMGGKVKTVSPDGTVKINLNGRLGVLTIPADFVLNNERIAEGSRLRFYFSYVKVVENAPQYDPYDFNADYGIRPTLIGGIFTEVNDTAVKITVMDGKGTIAVPRRWIFTDKTPEENLQCEMYLSRMEIIN